MTSEGSMKLLVSSTWLLILKLEEGLSAWKSSDTCILLVSSSPSSGISVKPCPSLLPLLLEVVRCAFLRHHRETVEVEVGLLDSLSAGSQPCFSPTSFCTVWLFSWSTDRSHQQVVQALTGVVLSVLEGRQPLASAGSRCGQQLLRI